MVKIGLEIHQQLDTGKLFCRCPGELGDEWDFEFDRVLRPVISEMGKVDRAAIMEARRGRVAHYLASLRSSCAVEWDEEPPHEPDGEAVRIAAQIAASLGAKPVDEVQFMRKILIDGSAVTGFQRTALIATDGRVGDVRIETVCLEEDSARPVKGGFSLDRLGIPLVEIATGPDMRSGEEAREVAYRIGSLLRMARIKRGLGTIRQDLNISTPGGARVEIKGVQDLDLIPKIVEYEVARQESLVRLRERFGAGFSGVREVRVETDNRILKKGKVFAAAMKGAAGLFAEKLHPGKHVGKELAQYVRSFGHGGFFHSDEGKLPKEFEQVRKQLRAGKGDLIIMAAGTPEIIELVRERVEQFARGVPEDTRRAEADGSTTFLRPLPTGARMYPETDIPPFRLPEVERLETPEERLARLEKELPPQIARKLHMSPDYWLFEELGKGKELAIILTEHLPALRRKGLAVRKEHIQRVLELLEGGMAKEGVSDALEALARGREVQAGRADVGEVRRFIRKLVKERSDYIKSSPDPVKGLMGVVMKEFRGKVPGRTIMELLKKEID